MKKILLSIFEKMEEFFYIFEVVKGSINCRKMVVILFNKLDFSAFVITVLSLKYNI